MTVTENRAGARSAHRAPARPRDRRRPALVLAVLALAVAAVASLVTGGDAPATTPSSAATVTETRTVTVTVPVARTGEEMVDDYFVIVAVREGWTTHLTASGAVAEARAGVALLQADPSPATLTAWLAGLEARTGIPELDAWAFADLAVRTYAPDLVQLLP